MNLPSKIKGYRSRVINSLIDAVARYRPLPGPGLLATEGPGGTVLSLARAPASGGVVPKAWDVQIALSTESEALVWRLTFLRAVAVRGPVTRIYEDPNVVLPLDSGIPYSDYFCGVEFDTGTMAATVRVSQTAADVYDAVIPEDYSRVRKLLYKLRCDVQDAPQTVENSAWSVIEDYRHAFGLEVYL